MHQTDLRMAADQRVQREGAAFAIVVGAEDDENVLDEGDGDDGVDDEREHTQNIVVGLDAFSEHAAVHVQRGGPQVTIHHPDALKRQLQNVRQRQRLHNIHHT